jgi:anti-anti-sigma regulatory factor
VSAVQLASSVRIRDCVALKETLLPLLQSPDPVIIDVTAVTHVDTAALQLLFAFCRDRRSLGLAVSWQGSSAAWDTGIVVLNPDTGAAASLRNG